MVPTDAPPGSAEAHTSESERALSVCPHALRCPGCDLWGFDEAEQDRHKHARVQRALAPYSAIRVEVSALVGTATRLGYRSRTKLVVVPGKIGLYERGSHDVVDTSGCPVLDPELERVVERLRQLDLARFGVESLDLRRVDDGALLTLAVREKTDTTELERVMASELASLSVVGAALSERSAGRVLLLGQGHRVFSGAERTPHHVSSDLPWHYASHGSFVQAHLPQAARLYEHVLDRIERLDGGRPLSILELHAGSGTLSLALAARGHRVTAVESYGPAVRLIEDAAKAQNVAVRALESDARAALEESPLVDVVLVNPPRRGLEPALRRALARTAARAIGYVSCDPETALRDLDHLTRLGFSPSEVTPFDLMPGAHVVETWSWLTPTELPLPLVLHRDADLLAVVKAAHEPTHPQGDGIPSLLDRVRLLPGTERAAPVHRLDAETSGVCLFSLRPEATQSLAAALAAGEKKYLAWCKGVPHKRGTLRKPVLEGRVRRDAVTRYERIDRVAGHAVLEVALETGRRHQIRQHLAGIGHPLLGDARYGHAATNRHFWSKLGLDRCALHAHRIELGGERSGLVLEAPLAPDLAAVWARSRADESNSTSRDDS